jgi:agmatinase
MGHFDKIFQIGLRAAGSARAEEVAAAKKWGAVLIPDVELQEIGMDGALKRIPDGANFYLTSMRTAWTPPSCRPLPGRLREA